MFFLFQIVFSPESFPLFVFPLFGICVILSDWSLGPEASHLFDQPTRKLCSCPEHFPAKKITKKIMFCQELISTHQKLCSAKKCSSYSNDIENRPFALVFFYLWIFSPCDLSPALTSPVWKKITCFIIHKRGYDISEN